MTQFAEFIDKRVRVTIPDGRSFLGRLKAIDYKMNLIITEVVEKTPYPLESPGDDPEFAERRLPLVLVCGNDVLEMEMDANEITDS